MITPDSDSAFVAMVEEYVPASGDKSIFLRRYEHPQPEYLLLLVHGTAGHSEVYHDFAEHYRRHHPATIWAFDLSGHGRTSGRRGVFTFEDFLDDTRTVAQYAHATGVPVVLHGSSQGGEIAFHALERCPQVAGGVCMNILLNDELQMSRAIRLMRSRPARRLAGALGDRVRIPLRRFVDFEAAYQDDPDLLPQKLADPHYVWSYGLKSYHSVFNHTPSQPAAANTKPVLVACGEMDEVVDPDHVRACFELIGGPKDLFVLPGAGHQPMLFETAVYSKVVDSWVRERALGGSNSWAPPIDAEEQAYFDFLHRERRNEADGEPEYRYSWLDRALTAIANGTIERGVRYFSQVATSAHWQFTRNLVSKIDYIAWSFLRDYLPTPTGSEPPRIAVGGCGDGNAIRGLTELYPELGDWEIHGFDVDYKGIRMGRQRFADTPNVQLHVGDIRNPEVLPAESFDVVYLHGIFDHCAEHRAVLSEVHRALRPGGRVFVVAPDRNPYTWAAFVTAGPLWVFGLHKSIHDFRRFPRPSELADLFADIGYRALPKVGEPQSAAVAGLEYTSRLNPLAVLRSVRKRNLDGIAFELTRSRHWLGGGYLGEYVAAAEKPIGVLQS